MTTDEAIDFNVIRTALASLDVSASHAASGEDRPKVNEIYAPEPHAGALDPNVTVVLGARGAGKSFWAGVLGDDTTRQAVSEAYPRIGLNNLAVQFGFTGLLNDGSVSRATIDAQVPEGKENVIGTLLWRCIVLRALDKVLSPSTKGRTISDMMQAYGDPEVWENACATADETLTKEGKVVLVVFDALDSLALDWERLRNLTDALLEVAWAIRGYKSIRVKLFMRPDQLRDIGLRFVELPKLIAGATNLTWTGVDLYGMLFTRLGGIEDTALQKNLSKVFALDGITAAPKGLGRRRTWPLIFDRAAQARVFSRLAGTYMGRSNKKGRTYDWPLKHLSDGHNEVTPRSFFTLIIEAARHLPPPSDIAISAEGIRHGLREASKVRVDQLGLEFPWIKRVLAPLARLQVPCSDIQIIARWNETETIDSIDRRVRNHEFLGPFDSKSELGREQMLIQALVRIGVLTIRSDGRFDMPDLFRVAARLLKKGGVAPT